MKSVTVTCSAGKLTFPVGDFCLNADDLCREVRKWVSANMKKKNEEEPSLQLGRFKQHPANRTQAVRFVCSCAGVLIAEQEGSCLY